MNTISPNKEKGVKGFFEKEHITITELIFSIMGSVFIGSISNQPWIGVLTFPIMITNFRVLKFYD